MTETLWTIAMVAEYLVVSEAAAEYAMSQPDAPQPIVVPSRGTGARKIRRYLPDDIRQWATGRRAAA